MKLIIDLDIVYYINESQAIIKYFDFDYISNKQN